MQYEHACCTIGAFNDPLGESSVLGDFAWQLFPEKTLFWSDNFRKTNVAKAMFIAHSAVYLIILKMNIA